MPFLSNMAARYGWFTQAELTNMLAVSEATPGPIGVNMATYCGMKTAGVAGACVATFGLVLPSILCMLLLASLLARYQESRTVRGALQVLRPVSVGLVAAAGWAVVQAALFPGGLWAVSWLAAALFVVLLAANLCLKKLPPVVLLAFGAIAGIVWNMGGA